MRRAPTQLPHAVEGRPQPFRFQEPARGTIVLVKIVKDKACRAPVRSSAIARCLTVNALERRRALLKIESQPSKTKSIDIKELAPR